MEGSIKATYITEKRIFSRDEKGIWYPEDYNTNPKSNKDDYSEINFIMLEHAEYMTEASYQALREKLNSKLKYAKLKKVHVKKNDLVALLDEFKTPDYDGGRIVYIDTKKGLSLKSNLVTKIIIPDSVQEDYVLTNNNDFTGFGPDSNTTLED